MTYLEIYTQAMRNRTLMEKLKVDGMFDLIKRIKSENMTNTEMWREFKATYPEENGKNFDGLDMYEWMVTVKESI